MIPFAFIFVGGLMILSGINKDNPINVIKKVLTNGVYESPAVGDTVGSGIAVNPFGIDGTIVSVAPVPPVAATYSEGSTTGRNTPTV